MSRIGSSAGERFGIVLSIALCVVFIPVNILNMIIIVRTRITPEHIAGIFGIKPVIVLSGSMSPAFETNALIFIRETDVSSLKVGDIICYMTDDSPIAHRICDIVEEDGHIRYITKGDANSIKDDFFVRPEQVEGIYVGHIPGVGRFRPFMQSTTGMIICIVCPIALYLVWDYFRRRREGKAEEAKRAELEAELNRLRGETPPDAVRCDSDPGPQ